MPKNNIIPRVGDGVFEPLIGLFFCENDYIIVLKQILLLLSLGADTS